MKTITLLIPVYNEESVLPQLFKRLDEFTKNTPNYQFEFLFINDGSTDKSFSVIAEQSKKDSRISYINLSRNFGKEIAMIAGIDHVKSDALVIIDADLQDPPELIPDMLKLWEDGNEVIYGKRKARKGESLFKLMTAKMFYNTLNALSDVDIPKDTGDFRLVDRKVVDTINNLPEHNKFLRGLFSWVGYKQYAYEYERQERKAGKTKYPLKKMLKLASDGIVSFSTKPLKIVGGLGIITIIISIIILIYSLISYACNLNQLTPRVDFNNGCNNTI